VLDLLVVAILAAAGYFGWRRGALRMSLSVAGLLAGYLAATLLYGPIGALVGHAMSIPDMIAMPLGGVLAMLLIMTVFRLAVRPALEERLAPLGGREPDLMTADRAVGATLGVLWTSGVLVVVVWVMVSVRSIAGLGPELDRTVTARVSASVVRQATYAIAWHATRDRLVASTVSLVAAHPRDGIRAVNVVLRDPHARQLWADSSARRALARGDTAALMRSREVHELATDQRFLVAARQIGLSGGGVAGPDLAADLAERAAPLARAIDGLRADRTVRDLFDSSDVRQLLDRGDLVALASNDRVNVIVQRVVESLRDEGPAPTP